MPRNARTPAAGSVLLSTTRAATGAIQDSADTPAAIDGQGAISGWIGICTTGFTATVRDTDADGAVLLEVTGADGARVELYPDPEHWREFTDGLHLTVVGTGSLQLEYRPY
jgi:hypothetical protein